jgi:cytochrome c2
MSEKTDLSRMALQMERTASAMTSQTIAMKRFQHAALVLATCLMCTASPAMADAERGKTLAVALCARCHMSEGQGEKQGPMGVPEFRAVANRPGQSIDGIVHWLRSVPPMMPDHHLTFDESQSLAEFIMSLREK